MFDPRRFFPASLMSVPRPTKKDYHLKLNLSNNELIHPRLEAMVESFYSAAEVSWVTRYPYWPRVVAAIAKKFDLGTASVWISAGADQAIRLLIRLAAMKRHRVVLQWPNYATYATAASSEEIVGEAVNSLSCSEKEEVELLCAAACRPGPALFVVTNPHAFTGRLLPLDAIATLADTCERKGHLLVIDEAYTWFAQNDHLSLLERFPNLLLLRSFSKGFGMAGLRFAAILARPDVVEYFARTRSMAEVSGLSAAFVEYCLSQGSILSAIWCDIARLRDNAARTIESLKPGWSCPLSASNFQLVDTGTIEQADRVVSKLAQQGILVRSLAGESLLASCFRFTICGGNTSDRLVEALKQIK